METDLNAESDGERPTATEEFDDIFPEDEVATKQRKAKLNCVICFQRFSRGHAFSTRNNFGSKYCAKVLRTFCHILQIHPGNSAGAVWNFEFEQLPLPFCTDCAQDVIGLVKIQEQLEELQQSIRHAITDMKGQIRQSEANLTKFTNPTNKSAAHRTVDELENDALRSYDEIIKEMRARAIENLEPSSSQVTTTIGIFPDESPIINVNGEDYDTAWTSHRVARFHTKANKTASTKSFSTSRSTAATSTKTARTGRAAEQAKRPHKKRRIKLDLDEEPTSVIVKVEPKALPGYDTDGGLAPSGNDEDDSAAAADNEIGAEIEVTTAPEVKVKVERRAAKAARESFAKLMKYSAEAEEEAEVVEPEVAVAEAEVGDEQSGAEHPEGTLAKEPAVLEGEQENVNPDSVKDKDNEQLITGDVVSDDDEEDEDFQGDEIDSDSGSSTTTTDDGDDAADDDDESDYDVDEEYVAPKKKPKLVKPKATVKVHRRTKTTQTQTNVKVIKKSHKKAKPAKPTTATTLKPKLGINYTKVPKTPKVDFVVGEDGKTSFNGVEVVRVEVDGKQKVRCTLCSSAFCSVPKLKEHIKASHPNGEIREFECHLCHKRFTKFGSYNHHKYRSHRVLPPRRHQCDICGKTFSEAINVRKHKAVVHFVGAAKVFTCDICARPYVEENTMKLHRLSHMTDEERAVALTEAVTYPCTYCGKILATEPSLKLHERTHTNIRQHICEICGASFITKQNLRVHKETHQEEKSYKCGFVGCTMSYSTKRQLHCHSYVHNPDQERPFKCPKCEMRFPYKNALTTHEKTHTEERPFTCSICSHSFKRAGALYRHYRKVHRVNDPLYLAPTRKKKHIPIAIPTMLDTSTSTAHYVQIISIPNLEEISEET